MVVFDKRHELLYLAQEKGLHYIYDLLDKVKHSDNGIASTDGKHIYVNPSRLNTMDAEDQFFILSHEMLHITYRHHDMVKDKENYKLKDLLNVCQDIVINEFLAKKLKHRPSIGLFLDGLSDMLIDMNLIRNPYAYEGVLTTTALYGALERFWGKQEFEDLIDSLTQEPDLLEPSEDEETSISQSMVSSIREELKIDNNMMLRENRDIDEDFIHDTNYGDGNKGTYLNKDRKKVSTQEIVNYIKNYIGTYAEVKGRKLTYSRPSRRYQHKDLLLKGRKNSTTIKKIVVYLDVSGSMNQKFVSDMYYTLKTIYAKTKFEFYSFTYYVNKEDFKKEELYASGGTNITRVLEHITSNKHDVAIMVTDCEDRFTLDGVKSDLLIFTNNLEVETNNRLVKLVYF